MQTETSQVAKVFTRVVSMAGLMAVAYSIFRLYQDPVRLDWMMCLVGMVLAAYRAEVTIPGVRSKVTLNDTFIFIGALLLGPWAAAILATVDTLAKSPRGARRISTVGTNIAAMNLAILSGSLLATRVFGPLDALGSVEGKHTVRDLERIQRHVGGHIACGAERLGQALPVPGPLGIEG